MDFDEIIPNPDSNKMEIYLTQDKREYIPLAKLPYYGPPIDLINNPQNITEPQKDHLVQLYIATIGIVGIVILYHFFNKSQ